MGIIPVYQLVGEFIKNNLIASTRLRGMAKVYRFLTHYSILLFNGRCG